MNFTQRFPQPAGVSEKDFLALAELFQNPQAWSKALAEYKAAKAEYAELKASEAAYRKELELFEKELQKEAGAILAAKKQLDAALQDVVAEKNKWINARADAEKAKQEYSASAISLEAKYSKLETELKTAYETKQRELADWNSDLTAEDLRHLDKEKMLYEKEEALAKREAAVAKVEKALQAVKGE